MISYDEIKELTLDQQKEELTAAMYKVLEGHEKIPYTQDGLDFLLSETLKRIPKRELVFSIQPIEEMSAQDRLARKLPNITVSYK